jgi:hypothetical protein
METEFKGIPLIEIPKNIPSYNFLEGDFGREVLNEYNSVVKSNYKDNSNLKVLNLKDGIVKGSNSYAVFLMNKILSKQGLRTANSADVQKVINNYDKFLSGVYADLGVVLRTEDGANEYLAGQLAKQSKDRKYKFSNSNPLVFKPSDLELITDSDSPSGLGFKIGDSANPFSALELSSKNEGKKFKNTNKNGVPIFDKNGNRTNYTMNNGLSGFSLDSNSDLLSWGGDLAGSNDYGRVVVMNDAVGVAPEILGEYVKNLEKEKQEAIEKINSKFTEALKILKS